MPTMPTIDMGLVKTVLFGIAFVALMGITVYFVIKNRAQKSRTGQAKTPGQQKKKGVQVTKKKHPQKSDKRHEPKKQPSKRPQ